MRKNILILCLFLQFASAVYAKEIKIVSDKLEIIRTDSISIFSGNVYAIEDDLEIWSEKLTITSSNDETTIEEINAEKNVKIIRQELMIEGKKAKYDPIKNILTVVDDVKVSQNGNNIFCDKIIVDLENSSSIMKSGSTNRVKAVITSKNSN
tara:strand:+ start:1258 stop:1713 length:456 start_codon:yes stop_codon:yes gene_type:complete